MTDASPTRRDGVSAWLGVLSGAAAIAVAVWLLPASLAITDWPARGPVRVALLRPAWQLGAGIVLALVAAALAGRGHFVRRVVTLAGWLWLWAVPFAPWIPDRFPLLLIFAGPLRWVIPAAIVAKLVADTSAWRRATMVLLSARRRTIFVASLAIYGGFGLWASSTQGVIGDEPHYLIISQSLLRDGDIQIENNHRQRDFQSYFGGDLRPDYMTRGKNGEIYSIHAPGLPVLIAPVYAAGGRQGVVIFIAALAALSALAIFDLALLVAGRPAAVLTWAGTCLTVPFIPYSWSIFPEMPGALLVAWGALWLWQSTDRPWTRWLMRGIALAAWPWLHTKFSVFLAAFGLAQAFRLRRQPRELVAFMAPIAVSGLTWFYSFYAIYGVFNPEAPYGVYADTYILTKNIPHGLLGMFFDQKFGLFFYSPLYLTAVAGAWLLWRRRGESRLGVALLAMVVATFVTSTARLYMFWGGASAPARFLVPLVPCLAPMVAAAIGAARAPMARALVALWLAVGIGIAAIAALTPARLTLFSDPHGQARLLEMVQGGSPLALVFPTFTDPDWANHVLPLAGWLAGALAALAVLAVLARRLSTPWPAAGVACLVVLAGGAIATMRPSAAVRAETARRGAIEALTAFDGDRFRTFDYQRLSRATPERWQELTTFTVPLTPGARGADATTTPVTLPQGVYEARIWFNGAGSRVGAIRIEALNQADFGRVDGTLANPTILRFDLPVEVRRLALHVANADVAAAVTRVEILPLAVVPPPQRDQHFIRAVESARGRANAYLAYTDEHAYPEHGSFWTRGTAQTTILVAPGGASRMTLRLFTGPQSGVVTIEANGETRQVEMTGETEQTIDFAIPAGTRLFPLRVQSSSMFRPGEVDPSSRDMRGLGCQVLVVLD